MGNGLSWLDEDTPELALVGEGSSWKPVKKEKKRQACRSGPRKAQEVKSDLEPNVTAPTPQSYVGEGQALAEEAEDIQE